MKPSQRDAVAALAGALLLLGLACNSARAQQWSGQPFEFSFTPYLWGAWSSFDVQPKDPAIAGGSGTLDPHQVASHLTWIPFAGAAELRKGSFGLALDYIHLPLRAGIHTRDIAFGGGTGGTTEDVGSAIFLYRLYRDDVQHVDVGGGVRAWGLSGDISLNQGLLPPASVTRGDSWADGLAALRYHREFGNGFGGTLYGDIGAGGASLDWQGLATLDYKASSWIDLRAGFRAMGFDYTATRAKLKVSSYGPILGATFHFGPYY